MDSLRGAREKGVFQKLKHLVNDKVVDKHHLDVWLSVRKNVMHGNLVSPCEAIGGASPPFERSLHREVCGAGVIV